MTLFDSIIGLRIESILRRDYNENYEFFSPLGVYLRTAEQRGIYFGVQNDGVSISIEFMTDKELEEYCGIEYLESILSTPNDGDELNLLIDEQIKSIEIARFISEELTGNNFIIRQGKYAGMRLRTTSNELTFFNQFGGNAWMNLDYKIPNGERWEWINKRATT